MKQLCPSEFYLAVFEVDSFDNVFDANITSHHLVDSSQSELRWLSETPFVPVESIGDQSIIQRLQHILCFFSGTGVHSKLLLSWILAHAPISLKPVVPNNNHPLKSSLRSHYQIMEDLRACQRPRKVSVKAFNT